jgi:CRP-like cAMP-binding protein
MMTQCRCAARPPRRFNHDQTYQVSRLKRGEVCGELAVLTGEDRSEDAIAETAMTDWALPRKDFDQIGSLSVAETAN